MSDTTGRKPLIRFSIAALLFLMLCVGGYFGGYRTGYDAGMGDAEDSIVIHTVYPVGDLLPPSTSETPSSADFDKLIDQIVSTIAPTSWLENGGAIGEISPFPSNKSLVIAQNRTNHEGVASLLQQLRQANTKLAAVQKPDEP